MKKYLFILLLLTPIDVEISLLESSNNIETITTISISQDVKAVDILPLSDIIYEEFEYNLILGQSNAVGRGENTNLIEGYTFPLTKVYQWKYTQELVRYNITTGEYYPGFFEVVDPRTDHGFDAYYFHDVSQLTEKRIYSVKIALGGSGISPTKQWCPLTNGFMLGWLRWNIQKIREYHYPAKVIFKRVIWSQGEAELASGYYTQYADLCADVFDYFRMVTGNNELEFIIIKASDNQTYYGTNAITALQAQQDILAATYPNCIVINTDNCEVKVDNIHFSALGCWQISQNIQDVKPNL